MKQVRTFAALFVAFLPFSVVVLSGGCGKKESDAPPPPPTPATTTPPPPATVVPEEDAGADADADADAAKPSGNWDSTGLKKCCAALHQNAKTAPPDQMFGYNAAAAACDGMVASGQGRQAIASLRQFLKGANMPSSCQ